MASDAVQKDELRYRLGRVFGLQLPRGAHRSMVTPGHATKILVDLLGAEGKGPRLANRAVDAVRSGISQLGHDGDVAEGTELAQVLARPLARSWPRLEDALGVPLPRLAPPAWAPWVAAVSWLLCVAGLLAARIGLGLPIWAFVTALVVSGILALLIPLSIHREFPDGCRTVGDLAEHLLVTRHQMLNNGDPGWSEAQVAEVVELIARTTWDLETVEQDTPLPG